MSTPLTVESFTPDASYEAIYQRQKQLVQERIENRIPDTLLLGEHPPVITLGRGTHTANLLSTGSIPLVEIERGGDVTYHGPGQLVAYPILYMPEGQRDLHRYLRRLETVLINVLAQYNLEGSRNPDYTGVWVGQRKIASIGVAVKKWVTYHGIALNVTTNLGSFRQINPCGLSAEVMTSLEALLGEQTPTLVDVSQQFIHAFQAEFPHDIVEPDSQPLELMRIS